LLPFEARRKAIGFHRFPPGVRSQPRIESAARSGFHVEDPSERAPDCHLTYPSCVSVSEEIAELHEKYVEILEMRLLEAVSKPSMEHRASVRARMATLAARFPGSLRELDDLEIPEIRRRIRALDAVVAGTGAVEPWMEAIALFHKLARGALWAKRWLRGRKAVSASLEAAYAADALAVDLAREALAWSTELAAVARPPAGRVLRLVFARMGGALNLTEAQARRVVFGCPRSERKAGSTPPGVGDASPQQGRGR
jgi:hypothetical protein